MRSGGTGEVKEASELVEGVGEGKKASGFWMTSVGILIGGLEALGRIWMKKLSLHIGEDARRRSKKLGLLDVGL